MKASGSISESGISGSISGQKGNVDITPTGIELAINAGIGKLGVSTDYGGGIVVGIGGQKIVWGREGGYIHYQFFGFEMTVEARDCIVAETRKIAGKIIDSHTYPDPGCKPPEPPKPPGGSSPPGTSLPPGALSPADIDKAMPFSSCGSVGVVLHNYFETNWNDPYVTGTEGISFKPRQVRSSATEELTNETITSWEWGFNNWVWDDEIKGSLSAWDKTFKKISIGTSFDYYTITDGTRAKCFPETPAPPPPSAGNRPPMKEDCCKQLSADLADLKEVLAVKEILRKKFKIPGELLEIKTEGMPDPKPEILLNYAQVANAILLAINRYGIDAPIKVEIQDSDTTKKGDQSMEFTYNSPSVALQAILELLWELKGDNASRLKIQVRMAYAVTRILKIVAGLGESVRTMIKMLGIPFRYDEKKLLLEFNLAAAKKGSGFGKSSNARKGTSSTEQELESLLPSLLSETEYKLPVPILDAQDDDIRGLLVKILIAVESQRR